MIRLILPNEKYKEQYLQALEEVRHDDNRYSFTFSVIRDQDDEQIRNNFNEYVRQPVLDSIDGTRLPNGFVPDTLFWIMDGDEWLGTAVIRHRLTPDLINMGGNVGYALLQRYRGKGLIKEVIPLLFEEARKLGIKQVLITSNMKNEPSRKVILDALDHYGGYVDTPGIDPQTGDQQFRAWVNTVKY